MHAWLAALSLTYWPGPDYLPVRESLHARRFWQVGEATMLLLEDAEASGKLLLVHVNGKFYTWKAPSFRKSLVPVQGAAAGSGA